MTQSTRIHARTVLLTAGTAGFVALGSGVAGAEALTSPVHEIAPVVERALVEGVAPTVNSLAPEGVGPVADSALSELQETAHNPDKPAPDLSAPLPEGEALRTPVGDLPNPTSELADTVSGAQDATGLDGDPHDTVGHDLGRALEHRGQRAGAAVEDTATRAGSRVEETAVEVLPHTVESVYGLREQVDLPRVGQVVQLPDTSGLPSLAGVLGSADSATVRQSAAAPAVPNMWDLAYAFGLEAPGGVQDVMAAAPVTDDDYVGLGEEGVLGMVGQRNLDERITAVPQSSPSTPGLGDLTGAALSGDAPTAELEPLNVEGPLADSGLPRLSGTGLPVVDDTVDATLPQLADTGLPQVAEGVDTRTAEDLVNELGRGTDLLNELDTSDLVSIEGGTVPQETPGGMTQHPTFMDLPGSEALPVVS
ncbi:hypothetical protein A6A08_00895 [Nocardiopsis sp. TSRI0078]|uniref:hypothetical protein n=1 Tax=unclassified Nocardiopsis TaxID=2649073 RepID=UPI00093974EF|nr:hypothetical protein [Nocardiopsis sp. TSRI0078]OKI23392.1 hypothetical protein A6A08_00895 [Nocardiopsis sp. TSRI0078]